MSVLDDPRVTSRPSRYSDQPEGPSYLIDGAPEAVQPHHHGYEVVNLVANDTHPAGWLVFNSFGVWIGKTDHFLVDAGNEVDAKDVYPTAEAAVVAVLAGLEAAR